MTTLRVLRENVYLLLFCWGDATVTEICETLNLDEIQVLAALYVLKAAGKVALHEGCWTAILDFTDDTQ